jgi:ATP-dependent helicase HrpB
VHNRGGVLASDSVVKARLFVAGEVRELDSGAKRQRALGVVLSLATAIEEEWLSELFPGDVHEVAAVVYDPALRRVVAKTERRFRGLVLDEKPSGDPPAEEAAALLAREVAAGRCVLRNWNDSVEQWLLRVKRLRLWMPELSLPAIGEEDRTMIIQHICHGATSCREIEDRPVLPVVKSWLPRRQQAWVEEHAPERIQLPGGRSVKIAYAAGAPPTIAARIQDLYGIKEGLWIAGRRVAIRIQVLAPSNRPVQVTEDLSVFWRETYPKLRTELRRKYPKHEWR